LPASFIFLLLSYDINWQMLFLPNNLVILGLLIIAYSINVILICIPWKILLEIITNVKIKLKEVILISCRSNALKYVPGNVFQYIGRNEIALRFKLNHLDVGISTVIDILINVLSIFLTSLMFYFPGIKLWLEKFELSNFKMILVLFSTCVIIVAIIYIIFRKKIIGYIGKYKVIFVRKNIKSILFCMLYYSVQGIFTAILYIIIIKHIVGVQLPIGKINIVIGAFLLSWILGFIMIGAPAFSHSRAISFIYEILTAKNAFEAYFIISALFLLVTITG